MKEEEEKETGGQQRAASMELPHREAGVQPVGGAVLVLWRLTQARTRRAHILACPIAGEDPLIQAACGQHVFLVHPAQGQAVGTATQVRYGGADKRRRRRTKIRRVNTYRLSPKFMGSRKPLRPSSFPLRIWRSREEEVRKRSSSYGL